MVFDDKKFERPLIRRRGWRMFSNTLGFARLGKPGWMPWQREPMKARGEASMAPGELSTEKAEDFLVASTSDVKASHLNI